MLLSQRAAEAWRGESELRFAQVSAFLPVGKEVQEDTVMVFRSGLETQLLDVGVETPETGSLWVDAYSAETDVRVTGDKGNADATAVAVGGSFFHFHPYELLSGSYIYENDLMKDRVVLDYELAWQLFGGSDLEGMSVTIGGEPYYVAGVVRRETDGFTERARGEKPLIYMSYSAGKKLNEALGISCYELVLADPISNFAANVLTEDFAKDTAVVVQNTGRYSFGRILDIFKNFGARAVVNNGVSYPYWENAARVSEVYVARLYVFIALLAIVPLVCAVWLLIRLGRFTIAKIKYGVNQGKEAWDDRYARMEKIQEKRERRRARRGEPKNSRPQKPRRQRPEPPKASPKPENPAPFEEELKLDIESIVKEIMEENKD